MDTIRLIDAIARELALFAAFGFLIGGLDDLIIDLIWIARSLWRQATVYRHHPRADAATLTSPKRSGRLAIFVPAWREEAVIGAMIRTARRRFRHPDWRLYVGCYPNDPATIEAVNEASEGDPCVRLVVGDAPGPTTKAGCLNWLWRAAIADGVPIKAVILHDAEDETHCDELAVYDALIERFDLVQLPVEPAMVREHGWWSALVSSHYASEFAEAHGKQIVVREAVGAAVPSAGVGCAIRFEVLARIAGGHAGPFDPDSLTEDYELGLRIGAIGGRGAFVRLQASDGRGLVAVRACFPDTLEGSITQKARWIAGIALAGWDRLGWAGGLSERWMRLRDRRALLAALVLLAAYAALIAWAAAEAVALISHGPSNVILPPILLTANLTMLGWRLVVRYVFTARVYGMWFALLAPAHMLIGNVVAVFAALRALSLYIGGIRTGRMRWDKTSHVFPGTPP